MLCRNARTRAAYRAPPKETTVFHHVKDLQFNARVSGPDPRFARLLLEQFGGANGELKAAMQYFVQAFACRRPYPDKYDLLMDIATEEFSHLEIVGATITMLLDGVNGDLKNAAERSELAQMLGGGRTARDQYIHESMMNPHFLVLSGGGPLVTDCHGHPWNGTYVNANGDLTVDLRSDIAAEGRAKIVYEYLLQFTDDPLVKESLQFLMAREVAHAQMFEAALATIQPNFPPGVLQSDPRFSNVYFNLSNGDEAVRGPWNEGASPEMGEEWRYVDDPVTYVRETEGLTSGHDPEGTERSPKQVQQVERELSRIRHDEVTQASPDGPGQWSSYGNAAPVGSRRSARAAAKPEPTSARGPVKKARKAKG